MPQHVDVRVHDQVALDEIDLYTDVLSAVAASDGPLTVDELDRALGVPPRCGSRGVGGPGTGSVSRVRTSRRPTAA